MKRNRILILLLCLPLFSATMRGEMVEEIIDRPHEVRLLIGDMQWETLIWHNDAHGVYTGAGDPTTTFYEKTKYAWSPHLGLEYQYRINYWLGVGLQADFQTTTWHLMGYNNMDKLVSDERQYFYNLCFLPTVRFTYFHHPYVNLYSSIGAGLVINGGSEKDLHGNNTAYGGALDIAVLGLRAGKDNWYGSIELGGLSALKNKQTFYMLCSRIFTVGVSYTF